MRTGRFYFHNMLVFQIKMMLSLSQPLECNSLFNFETFPGVLLEFYNDFYLSWKNNILKEFLFGYALFL